MAYLPNDYGYDPRNPQGAQQFTTGAGAAGGGASSGAAFGGAGAPQSQAPKGSGFVNIDAYLAPNAAGAQQMGSQIAGEIQQKGQGAISPGPADVYSDYTQDQRTQARNTLNTMNAWSANPSFRTDDAQSQAASQAWTGPQSSRAAALQERNRGSNYTRGMSQLDAWLLGSAGMGDINKADAGLRPALNAALDWKPQARPQPMQDPAFVGIETVNTLPAGGIPPAPKNPPAPKQPTEADRDPMGWGAGNPDYDAAVNAGWKWDGQKWVGGQGEQPGGPKTNLVWDPTTSSYVDPNPQPPAPEWGPGHPDYDAAVANGFLWNGNEWVFAGGAPVSQFPGYAGG